MQTLLAIGALVIAVTLGMSAAQQHVASQARQVTNEAESVALGVGTDYLNRAMRLRFDRTSRVVRTGELTPAAEFGGAASWAEAADLDDVHGVTEQVQVDAEQGSASFTVSAQVRYLTRTAAGFEPSASPTPYKEIELTVVGPGRAPLVMRRVYGCLFNV